MPLVAEAVRPDALSATAPPADASSQAWPAFYAEVGGGEIPFRPVSDYRPRAAIASDLQLSLPEVIAKGQADGREATLFSLFADVVRVPAAVSMTIVSGGLFLVARRIELEASITLDLRQATLARVAFVAQEVSGPLLVTVIDAAGERQLDLTPGAEVGRMLTVTNGVAVVTDVASLQASYDWDSPLRGVLTAILQYGSAAFDSHPDVARQMFTFVMRVSKGVDAATDLSAQSAALLAALNTTSGSLAFVPYLSQEVYGDQAKAFADAALSYEEQRRVYVASSGDAARMREAGGLMLARYKDAVTFNTALLNQAKDNLALAQSAAITAKQAVILQTDASDTAAIGFQFSSKIWAREQAIEAAFEVISAIMQVVGSVALMAGGDEAAGASAAKGVAGAAKAGGAVGEAAAKASDVITAAKAVNNVVDGLVTLKGAGETIGKLIEAIPKIIAAVETSQSAAEMASIDLPAASLASTDPQWDVFLIDCGTMLTPAVDAGVPGAADYLGALQKLVVYAKAAMAAQAAVVTAGQEVLRLSLQKYLDEAQRDRIQVYMTNLETDVSAADALGEIFFARELSMRLWLFLAFRGYADAFNYWALRPSQVKASMVTPVAALRDGLANIAREYADVLKTFNPAPQVFRMRVAIPDTATGPYAGVVAALRTTRTASVAIPLDEPAFRNLGRVRLTSIRAWMNGVPATEAQPVTVDIKTSNYFEDRLRGATFAFSAAPVERAFQYAGAVRDEGAITLDGSLEEETRFCLFQPTPFTQLTLGVADVALTGLTDIILEFAGSAIRDTQR